MPDPSAKIQPRTTRRLPSNWTCAFGFAGSVVIEDHILDLTPANGNCVTLNFSKELRTTETSVRRHFQKLNEITKFLKVLGTASHFRKGS
ncbi:hypothetical protein NPIL_566031 [Nephila pilipes]|uniref:Uncharacterized protein n=1 Tax=Nephila pilipes TaxID=299642 RepID=A0A8X6UVC6_NEPPI|nr:hypothetical protein NPIL_566031 [Nephila pilipes]